MDGWMDGQKGAASEDVRWVHTQTCQWETSMYHLGPSTPVHVQLVKHFVNNAARHRRCGRCKRSMRICAADEALACIGKPHGDVDGQVAGLFRLGRQASEH
eukprot:364442-Chlamydomonas_euryale.AAC.6